MLQKKPDNKLSVILITKNEGHNLKECLASINFAHEIIIVDSGSTDNTVLIGRQAGAKVIETNDWPGFGPQKNRALAAASGEWILSIDADERVPAELRDEIIKVINDPIYTAYALPRLSSFFGYFIRHSGWYPDYVIRLFSRDAGCFSTDSVHEKVILNNNSFGHLKTPILHYSYRDDSDFLRKLDQYSSLGAQQAFFSGKNSTLTKAISHAIFAFFRSYIIRLGVLDGRAGLMVAISSAESTYHKYLKLMLLIETKNADSVKNSSL